MKVYLGKRMLQLPEHMTLEAFLAAYSPFGDEATICTVNGQVYRSIQDPLPVLRDGDVVEIYPLLIGG